MKHLIISLILTMMAIESASSAPTKGKGKFSLYYVAEVKPKSSGGIQGKYTEGDNKWEVFRLSPADTRRANLEGTVSVTDDDGDRHLAAIVSIGKWVMIPKGWEGKGNRMNPLVSYQTVAADRRFHPYGSRLFVPIVKGYETKDGRTLDGWFWVADVGGGIKGRMRFDVFVGHEAFYLDHIKAEEGKWTADVIIEHPPKLPAKYDPVKADGVAEILSRLGYKIDTSLDADDELPEEWNDPVALGTALTDFQRQHLPIPKAEYGTRIGAITQWFLHQAGAAVAKEKPYPAEPGGPPLAPEDPPIELEKDE